MIAATSRPHSRASAFTQTESTPRAVGAWCNQTGATRSGGSEESEAMGRCYPKMQKRSGKRHSVFEIRSGGRRRCLRAALLGGAHAAGANMQTHQLVPDHQALSMHIRTKVTVGPPLRVADIMSETLRLTANVTFFQPLPAPLLRSERIRRGDRPRQTRNRTLGGVRNRELYTMSVTICRTRRRPIWSRYVLGPPRPQRRHRKLFD